MELPPLQAAAMTVLHELERRGIHTQVVVPPIMEAALASLRRQYAQKYLMLTGVRIGESAARDQKIALSCSKDGAECGQGWLQYSTPDAVADVLAPIIHFRVCHVWDWLTFFAPSYGFPTEVIAAESLQTL